ncbi:MAG: hypothetical protein KC561_20705, partial [Myxococcales bacterium]|nr:hypothetical protein [Myxococcales bacterium]
LEELSCISTNGCNSEPDYEGTLCVDRICALCQSDEECSADSYFGEGAQCGEDGRCQACEAGALGCPCDGDTCSEGICVQDSCVDCQPGEADCVCGDDDTCDDGATCEAGVCVSCELGELDCTCLEDSHCDEGLRCDGDNSCEECPAGEDGCPCGEGDACDEGLECMSDLCGPETCEAGEEGCPCTDDDTCDEDLGCHENGFCFICDADAVGCACNDTDGCTNDLICDEEVCRDALTCDEADCLENQECEEGEAGEDATCLESCTYPYEWSGSACVLRTPTNCDANGDLSILAACSDAHRSCELGAESYDDASCGDCVDNYLDDDGSCRAVLTCSDIADSCTLEYRTCTEGSVSADATC